MSRFVVDAQSLRLLERSVLELAFEFESGSNAEDGNSPQYVSPTAPVGGRHVTQPGSEDTVDTGALNGADEWLDGFYGAWQDSLAVAGKMMAGLAQNLGQAATSYAQTERSLEILLSNLCHPHPSPHPPTGGLGPMLIGASP